MIFLIWVNFFACFIKWNIHTISINFHWQNLINHSLERRLGNGIGRSESQQMDSERHAARLPNEINPLEHRYSITFIVSNSYIALYIKVKWRIESIKKTYTLYIKTTFFQSNKPPDCLMFPNFCGSPPHLRHQASDNSSPPNPTFNHEQRFI